MRRKEGRKKERKKVLLLIDDSVYWKMSGAVPPLPHMPPWHRRGLRYTPRDNVLKEPLASFQMSCSMEGHLYKMICL